MKHARDDYNRIQDPAGKIPDDEPVFLIRGQDACAAATVEYWARLAADNGASQSIVSKALEHAERIRAWSAKKVPDL